MKKKNNYNNFWMISFIVTDEQFSGFIGKFWMSKDVKHEWKVKGIGIRIKSC